MSHQSTNYPKQEENLKSDFIQYFISLLLLIDL